MDISITGVTGQRKFLKTCVRLRWFLDELRQCCDEVDTAAERFDVLQLVFMDRPESFLHCEGTKGDDRLFQVQVGIGLERDFTPERDRSFLSLVADQALRAVQKATRSAELREEVSAKVARWKDSLGERLDDPHTPKA